MAGSLSSSLRASRDKCFEHVGGLPHQDLSLGRIVEPL